MIAKYRLSRFDLKEIAYGHPVSNNFRIWSGNITCLQMTTGRKTYEVLNRILPMHKPRYQLGLMIIFNLYLMVFERIDVEKGTFKICRAESNSGGIRKRVTRLLLIFRLNERFHSCTLYLSRGLPWTHELWDQPVKILLVIELTEELIKENCNIFFRSWSR